MVQIAPVYLRLLMDQVNIWAADREPEDPQLLNEALQYAARALDGNTAIPDPQVEGEPSPATPQNRAEGAAGAANSPADVSPGGGDGSGGLSAAFEAITAELANLPDPDRPVARDRWRIVSRIALYTAEPIIRADERERIVAQIDLLADDFATPDSKAGTWRNLAERAGYPAIREALKGAAKLAREQS